MMKVLYVNCCCSHFLGDVDDDVEKHFVVVAMAGGDHRCGHRVCFRGLLMEMGFRPWEFVYLFDPRVDLLHQHRVGDVYL